MLGRRTSHSYAILTFLIFNVLDAATTFWGLRLGLPEGNPVPALLLARYGISAMQGAKAFVVLGVLAAILLLGRHYPRLWWAFWVTSGLLVATVASNLSLIWGG